MVQFQFDTATKSMSLKQRFAIFSIIFIVLTGIFVWTIDAQTDEVHRVRRNIEDDWQEIQLLFHLQEHVSELHHHFELEEPAVAAEKSNVRLAAFKKDLKKLRDHAEDDLSGSEGEEYEFAALSELEKNFDLWADFIESVESGTAVDHQKIVSRANSLYHESSAAISGFSTGSLKELDNALNSLSDSEDRIEDMARHWTLGMIGLLVLAWGGFVFWLMVPIRRLRHMVRKLRARQFDVRPPKETSGEIGELTTSFIEMSREIRTFTQELESRVADRTRELEASRQQLRQMLDRLPDAVGLAGSDGRILMSNESYETLLGNNQQSRLDEILEAPTTPQGYYCWETNDGRTRYLDVQSYTLSPCEDNQDNVVVLEYVRDMTRQYEIEAALTTTQKLAAIGRLSSGIAHEINNPLTAIAACAEGLIKRLNNERLERETFADYLETIREEVFTCKQITEKLLDFSRQREEPPALIHLGDIASDTVHLTEPLASKKNVRVEIASTIDDDQLYSNARAIRQILLNLILNGIEACNEGGGILVRLEGSEEDVAVRIEDDGTGIAPEHLEHLFEPFFTHRRDQSGTGLGLFVCQGLVNALGGSLAAESEGAGKGATFTVQLPRRRKAAEPAPQATYQENNAHV